VTLKDRAQLAQRRKVVAPEVAGLSECGVEHRRGMAFGEDESISARPARVRGVVTQHLAEVERGDDIGG